MISLTKTNGTLDRQHRTSQYLRQQDANSNCAAFIALLCIIVFRTLFVNVLIVQV
jgi:hypothetical protein